MKTSLRRPRQIVGVKTSWRHPCCLYKKEKGKKEETEKNQFNPWKLLQIAGTQCKKEASQHKDMGSYQVTRHPHIHSLHEHSFFQGLDTIGSWFSLLQEAIGLSTGSSVFLQETSCRAFGRARIDCTEGFGA